MKRIGIIGGLSPQSTLYYYEKFIEISQKIFPPNFYLEIIIYSLNFKEFEEGNWEKREKILLNAANSLVNAGAEVIGIAANTPHKVFPSLQRKVKARMVSIIEAVGREAIKRNMKKLLLLGTKITMEEDFYRETLREIGIDTVIPSPNEREAVDRIIKEELTFHNLKSKKFMIGLIEKYASQVDGVILGCTEIPLLVKEGDVSIPVLDSSEIHVRALIEEANLSTLQS